MPYGQVSRYLLVATSVLWPFYQGVIITIGACFSQDFVERTDIFAYFQSFLVQISSVVYDTIYWFKRKSLTSITIIVCDHRHQRKHWCNWSDHHIWTVAFVFITPTHLNVTSILFLCLASIVMLRLTKMCCLCISIFVLALCNHAGSYETQIAIDKILPDRCRIK